MPLPDKATRAQLIQKALKGVACDLADEQYVQLADKVAQYSGRDLVAVCRWGGGCLEVLVGKRRCSTAQVRRWEGSGVRAKKISPV